MANKVSVNICMKWYLQVDVEYTTGLQFSMYLYFLFYCDKNKIGCLVDLMRFSIKKIVKHIDILSLR